MRLASLALVLCAFSSLNCGFKGVHAESNDHFVGTRHRQLVSCSSLVTAADSGASISVGPNDFFLVQPSDTKTSYPKNVAAAWRFSVSPSSTHGLLVEVLELNSETRVDILTVSGRTLDSSASTSTAMSGRTPPFTSRIYRSGVALSWRSDRSSSPGVGFRVRVSRTELPGTYSPGASLSGLTVKREYAAIEQTSNSTVVTLPVPANREVALQAAAPLVSYPGNMDLTWTLMPQGSPASLRVDILDMNMRNTDSVTLSASGWSLVLSGGDVPVVSTYFVRGPMTVTVRTSSGNHVGSFDIRVKNSNTQPTAGTGAATSPNTCGGGGSLPPARSGGGGADSGGDGGSGSDKSGDDSSSESSADIGGVVGSVFPILIATSLVWAALRYFKQRKLRQQAAAAAATPSSAPSTTDTSRKAVEVSTLGASGSTSASSFAMCTASLSPLQQAPSQAANNQDTTRYTASTSPYPGTAAAGYGPPLTSPGGNSYPGAPPSTSGYPPSGAGYPSAYPPTSHATAFPGQPNSPPPYAGAPAMGGSSQSPYGSAYPTSGAYPGVAPGMAPSMAPYSSAYPAASAYPGAPPAYGSAPPSSTPGNH